MSATDAPTLLFGFAALAFLVLWVLALRRVHILRSQGATEPEPAPAVSRENLAQVGDLFARVGDRVHEVVLLHGDLILYANPQFAQLLGMERIDVVGKALSDLVPLDQAELVEAHLSQGLAGAAGHGRFEVDILGVHGQTARLEISSEPVEFEGGRALLITGVEVIPTMTSPGIAGGTGIFEVGGRSRSRSTLDSLGEGLLTTDTEGRIDYANPAAARFVGMDARQLAGRTLDEIIALVDRSGRAVEHTAWPLKSHDNAAEEVTGSVVLLHDVTEQRGLARQMSYQATHDALTGLVNRREFEGRLGKVLEAAHRGEARHVLCFLDLDHFKEVNDSDGHQAGDSLLREVAKLMREAVRDSDTVARLGGDEFALLLPGCPLERGRQIAEDLARTISSHRFVWRDQIHEVGASIGIVELARDSGTLDEALAAADSACYVAKKQGAGRVAVYSAKDEVEARHSGEIHWLRTLQSAIKNNTFRLFWQPIEPAYGFSGDGPAMEVLVRLADEAGNDLPPAALVRAAERYRLMGLVDRWVVQTTLTALGRGAIELQVHRSIAINVSGQTLADSQFLEFVVECFDRSGVEPQQVCFEIAEGAVAANLEAARRFVGVLHGMGCQFALDDFGSNIGSFSSLKNLPMDYLKIDGSFMQNLARDSVNQAMVTATIKLARSLNFKVIAEQVEDAAGLDAARNIGVDYVQGYAVGRPKPLNLAA